VSFQIGFLIHLLSMYYYGKRLNIVATLPI
jgi:hypothetical protein